MRKPYISDEDKELIIACIEYRRQLETEYEDYRDEVAEKMEKMRTEIFELSNKKLGEKFDCPAKAVANMARHAAFAKDHEWGTRRKYNFAEADWPIKIMYHDDTDRNRIRQAAYAYAKKHKLDISCEFLPGNMIAIKRHFD